MDIALYGYGKMGRAIEQVAVERGHRIVLKIDAANAGAAPTGADVAIEFSRPDHVVKNIELCLKHKVPVIVGTTGWHDQLTDVTAMVNEHKGALLWASNFSIGVNLFFRVNRHLAAMMDRQPGYRVHIDEVHHVHKLDAPSGTAITLAKDIDTRTQRFSGWRPVSQDEARPGAEQGQIPIASERTGEVPGKHSVTWTSAEDKLTITHDAFGRTGFAMGAVIAAEWLRGKSGVFTMDDLLGDL